MWKLWRQRYNFSSASGYLYALCTFIPVVGERFRLCSFSDLEQVHNSWLKTDLQLSLYVYRDVKARKYAESIYIPFRSSDVEISLVGSLGFLFDP